MDHTDAALVHLAQRDVLFCRYFHGRHGYRSKCSRSAWDGALLWCHSNGNDFNRDYHVSFAKEEKANGKVYFEL